MVVSIFPFDLGGGSWFFVLFEWVYFGFVGILVVVFSCAMGVVEVEVADFGYF